MYTQGENMREIGGKEFSFSRIREYTYGKIRIALSLMLCQASPTVMCHKWGHS